MRIIISGLGAVGKSLMKELVEERQNIVVVDLDGMRVEEAVNTYDVKGVIGNCASSEVLKEAGVDNAELLIATTSNDELNILTCIIANKLGVKKTIARASKPEYRELFENEGDLGLSLMVNPQYEAAMEICRMLRFPSAIKVNQFSGGKVELVEFRVPTSSPLIGIPLKNLGKSIDAKVLICAAQRDGKAIIPTGDFVIRAEDRLFLTATTKNISLFFKQLGWNKSSRNVMVVGGSTTAYYLCHELERIGIHAKLFEKNKDKSVELARELHRTEVVWGDGTDQSLLLDEGLDHTDAFVALGNLDEQNIIMSMFASSREVPKVITKIDQLNYYDMLQKSGIYSAVSTKTSTADEIVRFVRAESGGGDGSVQRLFQIIDDEAEILEFGSSESFRRFGVPLSELNLKNNLLVAGIIRKDVLITPSGRDTIEPGDHVIVVTKNEGLKNLNDILAF